MSESRTKPVDSNVAKVNDELAVGEDLDFQKRWWKFERSIWWFFLAFLILNLVGVFGKGPLAHAHFDAPNNTMSVEYERVARAGTPSLIAIHFMPGAVRDGRIQLWVNQSLIKDLSTQRVIPQPLSSEVSTDGITYTWPAAPVPDSVQLELQPSSPGLKHFLLKLPAAGTEMKATVLVMP